MSLCTPNHSYDTCDAPQVARGNMSLFTPNHSYDTCDAPQVAREGTCLCLPPATVMTHVMLHRLLEGEHVFVYPQPQL